MKITVRNFKGEIPLLSRHLIPNGNAVDATDCKLKNGGIDPLKDGAVVTAVNYANVFIEAGPITVTTTLEGYFGLTPPVIEYFTVVEWTGNNTRTAITGVGFKPDFIWARDVDRKEYWSMIDVERGVSKIVHSNKALNEIIESTGLMSFDDDGFTVGTDDRINKNGEPYIAYCFKKGESFFDVVKFDKTDESPYGYTGSHDLGVAPEVMILKNRNRPSGAQTGKLYYTGAGIDKYRQLDTNAAFVDDANDQVWANTAPTTTEFTIGKNDTVKPDPFVIYLFASKAGLCKIGEYTGTGVSGITLTLGFTPMAIMITPVDDTGGFNIFDTERNSTNPATKSFSWDEDDAEQTWGFNVLNFNANDVEILATDSEFNVSGKTYMYMAFAEP